MAQIDGAGQQDTGNQNAEALQAALAQRQVTRQGQPQGGSDVPSHENSDPVSDESEILRSRQPLTGKRRVPWRSRTEGLHGRSRVGGSAPSLCQRAGCYQSRPWDLRGGACSSINSSARRRFARLRLAEAPALTAIGQASAMGGASTKEAEPARGYHRRCRKRWGMISLTKRKA